MTDRAAQLSRLRDALTACETNTESLGLEMVSFFIFMALQELDTAEKAER